MTHFTSITKQAPTRNSLGFTLIELLVTIAIIGILAAILIPAIGRVRAAAENATCASNMRELGQGLLLFTQDNKGQIPLSIQPDPLKPDDDVNVSWQILMMRQLDVPFAQSGDKSIFICPSHRLTYPQDAYRTYALNLSGAEPTTDAPRLLSLSNPSQTALLLESQHESGGAGYVSLSRSINGGSGKHRLDYRHNGSMNMFMADGHIQSISEDDSKIDDYLLNIRN
jgi:general secretion pathway protein G